MGDVGDFFVGLAEELFSRCGDRDFVAFYFDLSNAFYDRSGRRSW